MKLIVGLGNPDKEYLNTYHNLGFMVIDALAEKLGVTVNKETLRSNVAITTVNGEKVILAKPQTYMNLSGESVFALMSYYKISLDDLIVAYDDYDLPKGEVRIRKNGSAGTHNGMKNIVSLLGSSDFARVRIGFNPNNKNIELIKFVLSGIPADDKPLFNKSIESASSALMAFAEGKDFDSIMRNYTIKPVKE